MSKIAAKIADFIRETDKALLLVSVAASLFGSVAVLSATRYLETYRPFIVQIIGTVIGIVVAVIIANIDFDFFTRHWPAAAALGIGLIVITFLFGYAPGGTDDKAWLDLGFTTFQPSELVKICFIVTFSAHLTRVKENINKPKVLLLAVLHGILPVALIHFQGDDGTALVFAIMMVCMLLAAGVSWKYFVSAIAALLVASPLVYFLVMNDDQRSRVISVFDIEGDITGATYQQYRGRMALANGGFFGQGLFKGTLTQNGGVPEGQNDFIFVSIGEELGFLGCLLVIILLGVICFRCIRTAYLCRKDSGKIIAIGFFGMIFAQMLINLGMCLALLPVIGVTLPFFSAGGTSLVCVYTGLGLVLSVYMHRNTRTIYLHD